MSELFELIGEMPNETSSTMSPEQHEQLVRVRIAELNCYNKMPKEIDHIDSKCPMVWDGLLCWLPTDPGIMQTQSCPNYIHGFNPNAMASKFCTENATWFFNPESNTIWSNFTQCHYPNATHSAIEVEPAIIRHIPIFKLIMSAGYSVSLGTLIVAIFILAFVKRISLSSRRLRCPRNNLHIQLFVSFMIRSLMFFIFSPSSTSVDDEHSMFAFANYQDLTISKNYSPSSSSSSCKILTCIWQYSLLANYNWIFMEGLYLHNLIFLNIFNDNSSIIKYIILGWGLPVPFILTWAFHRALYDDALCWTTNNPKNHYYWIIRGPITATIILNFFFFLNITRVVFLKMFSSVTISNRQYRYRKWFKSTLVLVPLFGVHYIVLLMFSFISLTDETIEIIWLYLDLSFSSFQGCVVALLYCFCNGEVQAELKKLFQSWRWSESGGNNSHANTTHSTTTHHSILATSLTYLSRGRNSVLSTCDNIINRKEHNSNNLHSPNSLSPNASRKISPSGCISFQPASVKTPFLQINDQIVDFDIAEYSNESPLLSSNPINPKQKKNLHHDEADPNTNGNTKSNSESVM